MENRTNKTKPIVEAGIITGIVVVLSLIDGYLNVLSFIGIFITPIPIAILYLRHNIRITLMSILCSTILVAILFNPISSVSLAIIYGLTGIALGYCIKKKLKMSQVLLIMTVVSIITIVLNISIYILLISKTSFATYINSFLSQYQNSLDEAAKISEASGQPKDAVESLKKIFTGHFITVLMMPMLILNCFFTGYLNYLITEKILKKLKYKIESINDIKKFYINNRMVACMIIIGAIGFILKMENIAIGEYIYYTALIVGLTALTIDGAALLIYVLRTRFKLNKWIIILIIALTLTITNGNIVVVYIFVGIQDMIIDFRKLDPNRLFKNFNK
ncbi:MAG: DUF2232 domain-containing protein [Bacillota bacterium]|nr:DUF2232 domain-containing protein [Bacillota bacterium]